MAESGRVCMTLLIVIMMVIGLSSIPRSIIMAVIFACMFQISLVVSLIMTLGRLRWKRVRDNSGGWFRWQSRWS